MLTRLESRVLLEVESNPSPSTHIAQFNRPLLAHRAEARTTLAPGNQPMEPNQVVVNKGLKKRLRRNEPNGRRDFPERIDPGIGTSGTAGCTEPHMRPTVAPVCWQATSDKLRALGEDEPVHLSALADHFPSLAAPFIRILNEKVGQARAEHANPPAEIGFKLRGLAIPLWRFLPSFRALNGAKVSAHAVRDHSVGIAVVALRRYMAAPDPRIPSVVCPVDFAIFHARSPPSASCGTSD